MYGGLRDDVGVKTVAEIYRIDVVTTGTKNISGIMFFCFSRFGGST